MLSIDWGDVAPSDAVRVAAEERLATASVPARSAIAVRHRDSLYEVRLRMMLSDAPTSVRLHDVSIADAFERLLSLLVFVEHARQAQ
jgi:hypothetical protein